MTGPPTRAALLLGGSGAIAYRKAIERHHRGRRRFMKLMSRPNLAWIESSNGSRIFRAGSSRSPVLSEASGSGGGKSRSESRGSVRAIGVALRLPRPSTELIGSVTVPFPVFGKRDHSQIKRDHCLPKGANTDTLQLALMADFETDPIARKGSKDNVKQASLFDDSDIETEPNQ
jgi:hypothetical protein